MIEAPLLAQVMAQAASHAALDYEALAARLRGSFPGVHITVCGEDDVPARLRAAAGNAACSLYYVNAGGHCLALTQDAAAATGLVVAMHDDDAD